MEVVPATELDYLLSKLFYEHTQEKWRRVQARNNSQLDFHRKIVHNEKKRRIVIGSDEGD